LTDSTAANKDEVSALARGLALLKSIADAPQPQSNRELADSTGIPKATVSRLTATLQASGLLRQSPDSDRFALGPAALQLGNAYLRTFDFRQQALNERSEIATKLAVNEQSMKGASARVDRNELRAPVNGLVNDVQITTLGGFVNAGEKIMQVVPVGDKLLVEARIQPKDIAFLKINDRANVKCTAYDFSIYGGLSGKVRNISADSIYDEVERQAFYTVVVETDRAYLEKNGQKLPIMPGMICDVEIITGRKSVLAYLFKPVLRAFDEALTER
jgi:adhesin transport system membrane fusion protein